MKKIINDNYEDVFAKEGYKLVLTVVRRGFESSVLEAAKDAGHFGATIMQGKGVPKDQRNFLGLTFIPENTIVMMIVKDEIVLDVINKIYSIVDFKSEAGGLVYALPVSLVAGLEEVEEDKKK